MATVGASALPSKTPMTPTSSATVPISTAAAAITPTAMVSPAAATPFPDLALDQSKVLMVDLPSDFQPANEVNDFDAFGTDAVFTQLNGPSAGRGQQVWHVNLVTGQVEPLNQAQRGVVTLTPRISGTDVVWTADTGRPDGSVVWKIMHYDLSTMTTNVVASGTNTSLIGGSANAPAVDVDSGLVAYTVESPTLGRPSGWTIEIKRLSDGASVRTFDSQSSLFDLALSGSNVLFSQGSYDASSQQITDTGGYLSTVTNPDPALIAPGAFDLAFSADTMVWTGPATTGAAEVQEVWTATTETATTPIGISQQAETDVTSRYPAAGDGFASWNEAHPAWSYLVLWDRALDRMVRVMGHGDDRYTDNTDFFRSSIAAGWLTWDFVTRSMTSIGTDTFEAVRLDDVRAAYGGS